MRYHPIAIHEAGHATVALALGMEIKSATIEPDEERYGQCTYPSLSRDNRANLLMYYGGIAAEIAVGIDVFESQFEEQSDCKAITELHTKLADADADKYLDAATRIIAENQAAFSQIYHELLGDRTLKAARLKQIFHTYAADGGRWDWEAEKDEPEKKRVVIVLKGAR